MNELLSSLAGVIVGAASSYFAQKKITKSIIDSEIKRLYAQAEINDKSKRLDEIRECVVDILVLVEPIANREIDNMAVITNIHRLAMFLDVKNNPEHGELNGVVINLGLYIDELAVNGRSSTTDSKLRDFQSHMTELVRKISGTEYVNVEKV